MICYLCDSQITVVIERILAFSLSSPLAKFLNGLEILLSKSQVRTQLAVIYIESRILTPNKYITEIFILIYHRTIQYTKQHKHAIYMTWSHFYLSFFLSPFQDWENNASRSVSLRSELEPITQLIIQWRKLELKYGENIPLSIDIQQMNSN